MTSQAQTLIAALKALGLKHGSWKTGGDFTVETVVTRRTDRTSGIRYSEFGDAVAHTQNKLARLFLAEHADQLAADGFGVVVVTVEGAVVAVIVSTKYNPQHAVSTLADGEWSFHTVPAASAA
jgi:hypothetical protein